VTYGLTPQGFIKPTTQELLDEIREEILENIDPGLNLAPDQPLGQIIAIFANKLATVWEVAETLATAMNPDNAENFLLDNVCALTGTLRDPARKSTVKLSCNVNDGFSALAGAMTSNITGQPAVRFTNVSNVGPFSPAGNYDIEFECTEYGPVPAAASTLTTITVPVSGWNSCTNALDAVLGNFDEKDEALRLRRQDELSAPGACTVDSIRADVLQVEGVQQAYVFENVTLTTDSDGLPGKSIEVVVFDGTSPEAENADVAQVVWDSKPSGSQTYGDISQTVKDSTGVNRTVYFSRATVKNVWFEYDVTIDPNFFPSNGAALIKAAAVAYAAKYLNLGIDVFAIAFKAQALTVAGVLDVPALRLGFSSSPVGTSNLSITNREIASVDTSRISVSTTPGSP